MGSSNSYKVVLLAVAKQMAADFPKDWLDWFNAHIYPMREPEDVDYIDFYIDMTHGALR